MNLPPRVKPVIIPPEERSSQPLEGPAVLTHPDMERAWRHIVEEYEAPRREYCILLTCSMRRPYHVSPSHRIYDQIIFSVLPREKVHLVVFGTCGVVPRELDGEYPFTDYRFMLGKSDPSVKRAFVPHEAMRLAAYLERNRDHYEHVVAYAIGVFREAVMLAGEMTGIPIKVLPHDDTITALTDPSRRFPAGSLMAQEYLQDLSDALADIEGVPRKEAVFTR